jgi:hypothetical protein
MNPCVAAKRIANSLHSQHLGALRGVTLLSEDGFAVLFGNDDYAHDTLTREEVRLILDKATDEGVEVLGFETDDRTHSAWAMALRSTDLEWLRKVVRDASYRSHCSTDEEPRIVVAQVVESIDPQVGVGRAVKVNGVSQITDESSLAVEGEDRSL